MIDEKKISYISIATLHEGTLNNVTPHPLLSWDNEGDMVLDFSESPPEQIWNTLSSDVRKKIRRFDNDGFIITEVRSRNDLELFYNYYYANVKNMGGIIRPFSRFSDLWEDWSDEIRITMLSKGPLVAGGNFDLLDTHRRIGHGIYLSINRNLPNRYSPSVYIMWKALNWAYENNFKKFSFGGQHRDENNPKYKAKYAMGAQFIPLYSAIIPLTKISGFGLLHAKRMKNWWISKNYSKIFNYQRNKQL
jgi:hypothetical protein